MFLASLCSIFVFCQYAKFTRIVFDTAPTGHTLRLLSLPDFLDATLGKVVRLRQKLAGAAQAVKGLFGVAEQPDAGVQRLEALRERLAGVRSLFRDAAQTEFVIVTIPTVLAVAESQRLLASLRAEDVPVRRLVVNQLLRGPAGGDGAALPAARAAVDAAQAELRAAADGAQAAARALAPPPAAAGPGAGDDAPVAAAVARVAAAAAALGAAAASLSAVASSDAQFAALKRRDQARALALVDSDAAGLGSLARIDAPLFDLEIRGVPALRFFGGSVWT